MFEIQHTKTTLDRPERKEKLLVYITNLNDAKVFVNKILRECKTATNKKLTHYFVGKKSEFNVLGCWSFDFTVMDSDGSFGTTSDVLVFRKI